MEKTPNLIGSDVAKDWIEPHVFKDFLHRVRDRADFLLEELGVEVE